MGGMPALLLDGHINAPLRPLHEVFRISYVFPGLWWGMRQGFVFGKTCVVHQPLCSLFRVVTVGNAPISFILGSSSFFMKP